MNTYRIEVYPSDSVYDEYNYHAVFEGYDGAPIDHETPSGCKIGYGDTEMEAMFNLLEQSL